MKSKTPIWLAFAALSLVSAFALLMHSRFNANRRIMTVHQLCTIYEALHLESQITNKPIRATCSYLGITQSWRVIVYKGMTANSFGGLYALNETFDSDRNLSAATSIALANGKQFKPGSVYVSPEDKNASIKDWTSYLRITGPGTYGDGFNTATDVSDGADKTILVVLVYDSGVFWTDPTDLSIDKNDRLLHQWMKQSSKIALFGNGKVRQLDPKITLEQFFALCTCNGGEEVRIDVHTELSSDGWEFLNYR